MSARPLIIDEEARTEAQRVIEHATNNPYVPFGTYPAPGDDPRFVAKFGTYRAVFTFTHVDGLIYRHLSISVPSTDYPHPAAAFMIADLFGFTGYDGNPERVPPEWDVDVNGLEHCIVIVQPIGTHVPKEALQ
jgi:hypothetical protein